MATCPHCNENGISSFKANMSNPGKVFVCSSCNKKTSVPTWPKALGIAILVIYFLTKHTVDPEVAIIGLIIATVTFLFVTGLTLKMDKV